MLCCIVGSFYVSCGTDSPCLNWMKPTCKMLRVLWGLGCISLIWELIHKNDSILYKSIRWPRLYSYFPFQCLGWLLTRRKVEYGGWCEMVRTLNYFLQQWTKMARLNTMNPCLLKEVLLQVWFSLLSIIMVEPFVIMIKITMLMVT